MSPFIFRWPAPPSGELFPFSIYAAEEEKPGGAKFLFVAKALWWLRLQPGTGHLWIEVACSRRWPIFPSQRDRIEIYRRDGGRCFHCGASLPFRGRWEIDHLWPRFFGGRAAPWNLFLSCRPCNKAKGEHVL